MYSPLLIKLLKRDRGLIASSYANANLHTKSTQKNISYRERMYYQMNNSIETGRRFLFMPSWAETAFMLPTEQGNALLRAIITYGVSGEMPTSDDIVVDAMMKSIIPIIDKSTEKYNKDCANGNMGGRPEKTSTAEVQEQKMQGKTQAQVAEELQISESTVRRKWKIKNDKEMDNKNEKEKKKDNEKEIKVTTGDTLGLRTVMTGYDRIGQTHESHPELSEDELPFPYVRQQVEQLSNVDKDDINTMASALAESKKHEADQAAIEHMYAVLSHEYTNLTKESFTSSLSSGCEARKIDISDVIELFGIMIKREMSWAQSNYGNISNKGVWQIMRAILDEAERKKKKTMYTSHKIL